MNNEKDGIICTTPVSGPSEHGATIIATTPTSAILEGGRERLGSVDMDEITKTGNGARDERACSSPSQHASKYFQKLPPEFGVNPGIAAQQVTAKKIRSAGPAVEAPAPKAKGYMPTFRNATPSEVRLGSSISRVEAIWIARMAEGSDRRKSATSTPKHK